MIRSPFWPTSWSFLHISMLFTTSYIASLSRASEEASITGGMHGGTDTLRDAEEVVERRDIHIPSSSKARLFLLPLELLDASC